jgi:hypothetical protein
MYPYGMKEIAQEVSECRICEGTELATLLDFGDMALTGVFLTDGALVPKAPLDFCRCNNCGLVQLRHSYSLESLYGDSYGYESHLNKAMVDHLTRKARLLEKKYLSPNSNEIVVDIASNDGTLLSGYVGKNFRYVGIDPLIDVVSDHYPDGAIKIKNFFSSDAYWEKNDSPASLVTSLSVLYDLDKPVSFAKNINSILKDDGIWHFEQSYLPTMIDTLSYDTICHEHLLYLSLHDIVRILDESGFKILDASLNATNGGSIAITAVKSKENHPHSPYIDFLLEREIVSGITTAEKLHVFVSRAIEHKKEFRQLLGMYISEGYEIVGLGASTKGNVLLQWLDLDTTFISRIGDVNKRKFGTMTPGTSIPIVSEEEIFNGKGKRIALVLPWHFREGIIAKSEKIMSQGVGLIFPLPRIEVVSF